MATRLSHSQALNKHDSISYDPACSVCRACGDDYGPPPMFAWEGSNGTPDHSCYQIPAVWLTLGFVATLTAAELVPGGSPADHLPPHNRQVTWFGEQADWSHDGSRILFLSKTFGDAMELELARMTIRNRTAHY